MFKTIKKWLQRSGINYLLAGNRVIQGTEMIDSINPFDDLIENPEHPMARIYREGFWTGLIDTYNVLVGKHFDLSGSGKGRKGVLDLLVFPVISRRLIAYAASPNKNIVLTKVAGLIGGIIEIPRHILGLGLTLSLSPVVALTHLLLAPKAYFLRKQAGKLRVIEESTDSQSRDNEAQPLLKKKTMLEKWLDQKCKEMNSSGSPVQIEKLKIRDIDSVMHCGFLVTSTPPTKDNLGDLPTELNRAYVKCGDRFYYVNKLKEKCIEITIDKNEKVHKEKLKKIVDATIKLHKRDIKTNKNGEQVVELLHESELADITTLTGHSERNNSELLFGVRHRRCETKEFKLDDEKSKSREAFDKLNVGGHRFTR